MLRLRPLMAKIISSKNMQLANQLNYILMNSKASGASA